MSVSNTSVCSHGCVRPFLCECDRVCVSATEFDGVVTTRTSTHVGPSVCVQPCLKQRMRAGDGGDEEVGESAQHPVRRHRRPRPPRLRVRPHQAPRLPRLCILPIATPFPRSPRPPASSAQLVTGMQRLRTCPDARAASGSDSVNPTAHATSRPAVPCARHVGSCVRGQRSSSPGGSGVTWLRRRGSGVRRPSSESRPSCASLPPGPKRCGRFASESSDRFPPRPLNPLALLP
eukprot:2066119-Rhodomonas_salina.3